MSALLPQDVALLRRLVDAGSDAGIIGGLANALELVARGASRKQILRATAMHLTANERAYAAVLPLPPNVPEATRRLVAELSAAIDSAAADADYTLERDGGGVRCRVTPRETGPDWPDPFVTERLVTRDVVAQIERSIGKGGRS